MPTAPNRARVNSPENHFLPTRSMGAASAHGPDESAKRTAGMRADRGPGQHALDHPRPGIRGRKRHNSLNESRKISGHALRILPA